MKIDRLYLIIGAWRGAPVRVHLFTLPAMLLLWGRHTHWAGLVALAALVLIHELGHAFLVRRYRARVLAIDLLPFGGECAWRGEVSSLERALISWGGVLAQALVFIAAELLVQLGYSPRTHAEASVLGVALDSNLFMIAFNLLPIPPLDGSKCWAAIPLWWRQRKRDAALLRKRELGDELHRLRTQDDAEVPDEVKETVRKALEDARKANRVEMKE